MFPSKCLVIVVVLCAAQEALSKPADHNYNEGRGIGSTIWGWLTYPFSWWGSGDVAAPQPDELAASTTRRPFETIEIGKHNVTIWCNDQTCTTMKCDRIGCVNITCNIYDTDLTGECREYDTVARPDDPTTHQPADTAARTTSPDNVPTTTARTSEPTAAGRPAASSAAAGASQAPEERPLELEAVLSSTVTDTVGPANKTIKPNN